MTTITEPEIYGRSPALETLPDLRGAQAKDRADLLDGTPEAMEDFVARRRPLWRLMGLIE